MMTKEEWIDAIDVEVKAQNKLKRQINAHQKVIDKLWADHDKHRKNLLRLAVRAKDMVK